MTWSGFEEKRSFVSQASQEQIGACVGKMPKFRSSRPEEEAGGEGWHCQGSFIFFCPVDLMLST